MPVDVPTYRAAIEPLGLGDISIAEVFDPSFRVINTWRKSVSKLKKARNHSFRYGVAG